jgi:hypothetical protein
MDESLLRLKNEEVLEVDDGVLCPERRWDLGLSLMMTKYCHSTERNIAGVFEEGMITSLRERLYLCSIYPFSRICWQYTRHVKS